MVHYDGTVRNALGQLIQLRYGEDGLDGTWVENQAMPTMKPTNALFEREFKLDLTDERLVYLFDKTINYNIILRTLRSLYQEDTVRQLLGSPEALKEIENEWAQLEDDRRLLRKIFPRGDGKVNNQA